ncbi:MAG: hypothetical protein LHV68_00825 [Elusimicrobia bacterium]|nr:hypothetical protein [Candidatus Liberimonas magnetica]
MENKKTFLYKAVHGYILYIVLAVIAGIILALSIIGPIEPGKKSANIERRDVYKIDSDINKKVENELGNIKNLNQEKDFNKIEKILVGLENKYPNDIRAFVILADFHVKKMEYDKAYKELEYVTRIRPNNTWALKIFGNLYFSKQEYSKAESYYLSAIECEGQDEDKAWTYHDMAQLYLVMKDVKKAFKCQKKALEYLPENTVIKEMYEEISKILKRD